MLNTRSMFTKIRFIVWLLVCMKCLESGETAKDSLSFIKQPISSVFVQRNQAFRVACLARGVPTPNIEWSKNNIQVEASEDIGVDASGALYFPNGLEYLTNTSDHIGVFRCILQNPAGVLLSRKVDLNAIYLRNISVRLSPLVVGNIARLECQVSSNQPVRFTWLKNNKKINRTVDSRITVLSNGVLQIRKYRSSDDGNYSCLARNKYTEIASRSLVVAAQAPSNSKLRIYPKKAISVVLGSQLVIECIQSGSQNNSAIFWTKVSPAEAQATALASGVNVANLILDNVTTAHSGQYLCQTTHDAQQITVSVKVPPSFISTMSSSIALKEGNRLTLSCEAKGNPSPSLTWFKNGQILVQDGRVEFVQNETMYKLTIDKLKLVDEGVYQCQAENELGSSMIHTIVDVEGDIGPPVHVRAYALSATKVNVTWSPPLAARGKYHYSVEYIRVLDRVPHQLATKDNYLAIDHLQPYTEYFIYVEVFISRDIAISKAVVVRTMEKIPNGPPLYVTLKSYTYGSLDITWLPPSRQQRNGNITAYNIAVFKPGDAKMQNITVVKNFYSYTLQKLQEGEKYTVEMTARTSVGFGPFSEKQTCIISRKANLEVLPAPNVVTKNINSSILVSVHMRASLGVTGYRISYRNTEYKADKNRNVDIHTRVANYYIPNLKTNAEYVIYVTAIGKKPNMARPFISVVTTTRELPTPRETPNKYYGNCTKPTPPLRVTCHHANNSTALVLNWLELPWKQPYQVIYQVKYMVAGQVRSVPKVITTTYRNITLSGLLPGNAYDVEIRAVHPDCLKFCHSAATRPGSECALPELIPGSPPSNVTCLMVSPSSIMVDWRPPTKPNGKIKEYQIRWIDPNNENKEEIYRTLGFRDHFSYSLKDVRKDPKFTVAIYAVNSAGVSPAGRCFIDTMKVEDIVPSQKSDAYDDIKLGIIIGCIISVLFVVFLVFFVLWSNVCGCRGEKPLVNTAVGAILSAENPLRNRMVATQDTVSTEISETSSKHYQILQKYLFEEASKESDRGLGMTPKNSRLCLDSERVPFLEKNQPQDSNSASFDSQDSGIQGYNKGSSLSSTVKDKSSIQSKKGVLETVC